MTSELVPPSFAVPTQFAGDGFHLEPLGPEHNERDHEAWMSSIEHIRATPGFEDWDWPTPMSLDDNRKDLIGHARDFRDRVGFTYSILDGDEVIGCVYIYPSPDEDYDAKVRSWVRASRAEMDTVVWLSLSTWLTTEWPFRRLDYASR
jgi:RimJ/RimL family protein N-acetyltransferase